MGEQEKVTKLPPGHGPKMTTGGGFRDTLAAWRRGAKRVRAGVRRLWVAFHNDQRLSWIGHWIVSALGSCVMAFVFDVLGWSTELGYVVGAAQACAYFVGVREPGDENKWRAKGKWDTPDADTNIGGVERKGVTPRYDKIGDLTGPVFNLATALLMWAW